MATNTAFVTALYNNLLFRSPSLAESEPLVRRLDTGLLTRQGLLEAAYQVPELNDMPYMLSAVYQAVFKQPPSVAQLSFWSGVLQSGATYEQIANQMIASIEAQQLYQGINNAIDGLIKLLKMY